MNPIRERVLDDRKGFVKTPESEVPVEQELAALRGEVLKLRKKLNQARSEYLKERDVNHIKLVDKNQSLTRENNSVKKENDKLRQSLAKAEGVVEQLKKEVAEKPTVVRKKVRKKV